MAEEHRSRAIWNTQEPRPRCSFEVVWLSVLLNDPRPSETSASCWGSGLFGWLLRVLGYFALAASRYSSSRDLTPGSRSASSPASSTAFS